MFGAGAGAGMSGELIFLSPWASLRRGLGFEGARFSFSLRTFFLLLGSRRWGRALFRRFRLPLDSSELDDVDDEDGDDEGELDGDFEVEYRLRFFARALRILRLHSSTFFDC